MIVEDFVKHNRFNAFIREEGKNETVFHDFTTFIIHRGEEVFVFKHNQVIPDELLNKVVNELCVDIELANDARETNFGNKFRSQYKKITLWIE